MSEILNKLQEEDLSKDSQQQPENEESTGGNLAGLMLTQELEAHTAWKNKLQKLIESDTCEDLDVVIASGDCYCTLGKWLYGKGKMLYGQMPEYEELRLSHANLHLCAGEILTQHILGNDEEAKNLLKTKFRFTSNKNKIELVRFFAAAKKQA